jgi:hypothetical protein
LQEGDFFSPDEFVASDGGFDGDGKFKCSYNPTTPLEPINVLHQILHESDRAYMHKVTHLHEWQFFLLVPRGGAPELPFAPVIGSIFLLYWRVRCATQKEFLSTINNLVHCNDTFNKYKLNSK